MNAPDPAPQSHRFDPPQMSASPEKADKGQFGEPHPLPAQPDLPPVPSEVIPPVFAPPVEAPAVTPPEAPQEAAGGPESATEDQPPFEYFVTVNGARLPVQKKLKALSQNLVASGLSRLEREMPEVELELYQWIEQYPLVNRFEISKEQVAADPEAKERAEHCGITEAMLEAAPEGLEVKPKPTTEQIEERRLTLIWETLSEVVLKLISVLTSDPDQLKVAKKNHTLQEYLHARQVDIEADAEPEEMVQLVAYIFTYAQEQAKANQGNADGAPAPR